MTHEEVEKELRQTGRICRGPLLIPEGQLDSWRERLATALDVGSTLMLTAMKIELETSLKLPAENCSSLIQLSNRVFNLIFARKDIYGVNGCGHNINDVICSYLFDGEEHSYKCPKCGVEDIFTAPYYEEDVKV